MQLTDGIEVSAAASPDPGWTRILECVIRDLDLLNHDTEQYFLKIGGKLAGFIDTVDLISSDLDSLVSQISRKLGQETALAFAAALDRSKAMQAQAEGSSAILGGLGQAAGSLKQILAGFRRTVSTFRTLGILTRIEGARLGDASAEFGGLASMAVDVRVRVERALASAAVLIPAIERALQNVSALEKGQAKNLPLVISRVLASLTTFSDIQKKSHDAAIGMMAQYDAISKAFTRLIVSMQFHDITRQQIEHVIEVLQRLSIEADGDGVTSNRSQMAAIVSLQSSQLADAARKFADSAASITLSLDDIAKHAMQMAEQSRLLFGFTEDEKNSFFVEIEQGCQAILTSLSLCVKAEDATKVTSDNLSQTIGGMRLPIEEIRAIGIQMQHVGMNARIRAANTGPAGNALGVLSRSIQQLALETQQGAEALLEVLDSMSEATNRLSGRGETASGSDTDSRDCYLEGMRTAVAELHSNERGFAQIAQIVARGTRLREDLGDTRKSFSAGAIFAQAITTARGMLRQIGGTSSSSSLKPSGGLKPGLVDFARHYTMQAERDVHESVTRARGGASSMAVQAKQS